MQLNQVSLVSKNTFLIHLNFLLYNGHNSKLDKKLLCFKNMNMLNKAIFSRAYLSHEYIS